MDFRAVIVVLVVYFIRPQDWVPGMSGMNIVKPLMIVAFFAMFSRRRGFSFGSLFRTPLDWLMLAYGCYVIFTAPSGAGALSGMLSLLGFYYVTSQALTTERRLAVYLSVWLISVLIVAGMAVVSEYGLDITGASEITNMIPETPRLVLNTYLFNNPNALGHTVVLAIPVLFFVFFWRRGMESWLVGFALIALAALCVYMTRSKGAYLVGFAVVLASQFIGRKLLGQLVFVLIALTIGVTAISQLPRMQQLQNFRQDEAILGRVLAWEVARTVTKEFPTGQGWKQFQAEIEFEDELVTKATHSAYVKIGADLGGYGMFLYLALIYAGFRCLILARCKSDSDERSRRVLFILLAGYTLSAWMIDRAYHLEYFLMLGAISAFHRRLGVVSGSIEDADDLRQDIVLEDASEEGGEPELLADRPVAVGRSRTLSRGKEKVILEIGDLSEGDAGEELVEEVVAQSTYWRRFGIIDVLLSLFLMRLVFEAWDYVLESL